MYKFLNLNRFKKIMNKFNNTINSNKNNFRNNFQQFGSNDKKSTFFSKGDRTSKKNYTCNLS